MIRFATENDIDRLAEKGREFYEASVHAATVPYDPESAKETLRSLIQADNGVVLVFGEIEGFIAGMTAPVFVNHGHLQAHELFWWVDREKRGSRAGMALLIAFERWAENKGADIISMSSLEYLEPEKVARMYEKCGYTASEHLFVRTLHKRQEVA